MYAILNIKFTTYKQNKKVTFWIYFYFFLNFPSDSPKIAQIFLNGAFNVAVLFDAIL